MRKEIIVYGAGGAGRELVFNLSLDDVNDLQWHVKGFVDDNKELEGAIINDVPVLGQIEYATRYSGNIAITLFENPRKRMELILKLRELPNLQFPVIVSPLSIVSPYSEVGEGSIINSYCSINPNAKIGNFSFINSRTGVGHDAIIGDYSVVFAGINIGGNACIGERCMIGSGVTILPGVKIGDGAVIGGGAFVSKNIPPNVVAAGVPAKVFREL